MEQTDAPKKLRRNYKIRSKRNWTLIRERYLAGESAPRLAEVFDVTEAAIRARAGRQGWTKRAMAEAMPVQPADAGLAEMIAGQLDGDLTPREAARLALGEAVTLLRSGKMGLAGEAARVADVMGRAAARLGDAAPVDVEPDEAAFEAVRRKVLGWDEEGEPGPHGYRHPAAREARPEDPAAPEAKWPDVALPLAEGDGATPPPPFGWSPSPRSGEETVAAVAPPPPCGWSPSPQSGEETVAAVAPPPPCGWSPSPQSGEETA